MNFKLKTVRESIPSFSFSEAVLSVVSEDLVQAISYDQTSFLQILTWLNWQTTTKLLQSQKFVPALAIKAAVFADDFMNISKTVRLYMICSTLLYSTMFLCLSFSLEGHEVLL